MSRQAAFKRFGEATNPATGDSVGKRSAKQMQELTEHVFGLIAADEQLRIVGLLIVRPDYGPLPF